MAVDPESSELPPTEEVLPLPDEQLALHGFIKAIGNLEGKTGGFIWLEAQDPLSYKQMKTGMADIKAATDGEWTPSLFSYCHDAFEPHGFVEETEVPGEIKPRVKGYRVTPPGRAFALPAAGLVAEWHHDYPDNSTQELLGNNVTHLPRRLGILQDLVTHPGASRGIALGELAGVAGTSLQEDPDRTRKVMAIKASLAGLEEAGVVSVYRISEKHTGTFRILDPTVRRPTMLMTPVTISLYEFLHRATKSGQVEFMQEDCLQYVLARVRELDPGTDLIQARSQLAMSLARTPAAVRLDKFNEDARTRVVLEPEHVLPLSALLETLDSIENQDDAAFRAGRRTAGRVAADPEQLMQLFAKSARFSPLLNAPPQEVTNDRFMTILRDMAPLQARQLRQAYLNRYDRALSVVRVRNIAGLLVKQGRLKVEKIQPDPSLGYEHNVYSPAPPGNTES